MQHSSTKCLVMLAVVLILVTVAKACDSISLIFPPLEGWNPDGERQCYESHNLFDYVNGAAELYLSYRFIEVATESNRNDEGDYITVDAFLFEMERDAFGMYSRERPRASQIVSVGVDGYMQYGVLGFCKGPYYVKVTCSIGEEGLEDVLIGYAERLATLIPGGNDPPPPVTWFPETGKIARSEQYIARDFLGHSFLTSTYVAEYESEGSVFRAFIVEATDLPHATTLVEQYCGIAHAAEDISTSDDTITIIDPYHESAGPLHLSQRDKYVVGIFHDDPAIYKPLLEHIASHIPTND